MIKRFADKLTQRLFHREGQHKKLDQALQRSALRKVIMIDNAIDINDLRVPPGNKLEALSED